MQEVDADRRMKVLRGQRPSTPPQVANDKNNGEGRSHGRPRERKRRRIAGENDTDRDIRLAKEDAEDLPNRGDLVQKRSSDAPVMDHTGHISLFPSEPSRQKAEKNTEAESEAAKKKREFEDQYTMRFSNAAGFKQSLETPWYFSLAEAEASMGKGSGKDVWGNEDPRRREREKVRMDANDPLAAIKQGVTQLREVERERKKWQSRREKEMAEMNSGRDHKRRRRRSHSEDDLEGFRLDSLPDDKRHHRRSHSHRHHRRRSRSRSRELSHLGKHSDNCSPRKRRGHVLPSETGRENNRREIEAVDIRNIEVQPEVSSKQMKL